MRWQERIELATGRGLTLGTLLERVASVHPHRRLVTELASGRELTTTEAAALVDRWAAAVAARTELGDRVVIATPNGYDQLLLTLAVVWLPAYLTRGAGYTPTQAGWIVTLPALCQIVFQPIICAFSERLTRRGTSSRIARGGIACAGLFVAGVLTVLLPRATGSVLPIVCTAIAFSAAR